MQACKTRQALPAMERLFHVAPVLSLAARGYSGSPGVNVLIRGGEYCRYGKLIGIMRAVKNVNNPGISPVTQPEP
jgi:hypothetical protein